MAELLLANRTRHVVTGAALVEAMQRSPHREIEIEPERFPMTLSDLAQRSSDPEIREIAAELARLRDRVEDLEDARELEAAIRRNGDKPLIPWDEAKVDLGLT